MTELRNSPLDAQHRALGARMFPFGGWDMPLEYVGTLDEHMACRNAAVAFDVSHLGTVRVTGPTALERLQTVLTNDLTKVEPGKAQYTHLLDEADGSVLDDIIVWWHPDDSGTFDVMPNASNTDDVIAAIGGTDITETRAVIAVQGPQAKSLVGTVFPEAAKVGRFRVISADWQGVTCLVAGTGYTGEAGMEIAVPVEHGPKLWDALLAAGVQPAGLGARDTLRLEAGFPLHGNELGPGISPLQAGLGWVVAFDKPSFHGKDALLAEKAAGVTRKLMGITTQGRRPPRTGCEVYAGDTRIGEVSSGNFSPVLGHGVALAFLDPQTEVGSDVQIDIRGKRIDGVVVKPPFTGN